MNDKLQTLLDKDAIIETVNRLFIGTDQRDWARVESCLASEVLFDMTSLAGGEPSTRTPQEIIGGWDQGLRPLDAVHHQVGNYIISVEGDMADLFCYGIAFHYLRNRSGKNTRSFVGSYDLHLVRVEERWLIDGFKFNLKYVTGNANLENEERDVNEEGER